MRTELSVRILTAVVFAFAGALAGCDVHRQIASLHEPAYVVPSSDLFSATTFTLAGEPTAEPIAGAVVAPEFFREAKATPLLGRVFVPADREPSGVAVAVLSETLWARRFGSDPSIIGRQIRLNDRDVTVVGVMPRGFSIPKDAQIWVPKTR